MYQGHESKVLYKVNIITNQWRSAPYAKTQMNTQNFEKHGYFFSFMYSNLNKIPVPSD